MFGYSRKQPQPPKASQPPPLPSSTPIVGAEQWNSSTSNGLDSAIAALKAGPWNPHMLISALTLSDAYLLLETPFDPNSFLLLIAEDKTPNVAFFSAERHVAAAREVHPGFANLHKVNPREFIMSLNDGVGFVINPYSSDLEYCVGTRQTATIRDIFLGGPS